MRELGTPVYDLLFFRELFREFGDDLRLTIVEKDGLASAAGICVTHGQSTEIHWAAARTEHLPFAPNMALYWEAISNAAARGLREFCFGRSTEDSGPYRFKKQWGAEPTRLHWEYVLPPGGRIPAMNPENPKYRLAVALWKKLPLLVTQRLGPMIVRHLP
jgi:lipid II:glycine glycyltransferase (peptidoglycan interpeptide bridge formation enzyme)